MVAFFLCPDDEGQWDVVDSSTDADDPGVHPCVLSACREFRLFLETFRTGILLSGSPVAAVFGCGFGSSIPSLFGAVTFGTFVLLVFRTGSLLLIYFCYTIIQII